MKADFYLLSRTFSYVLFGKNKSIDDEAKKNKKYKRKGGKITSIYLRNVSLSECSTMNRAFFFNS